MNDSYPEIKELKRIRFIGLSLIFITAAIIVLIILQLLIWPNIIVIIPLTILICKLNQEYKLKNDVLILKKCLYEKGFLEEFIKKNNLK